MTDHDSVVAKGSFLMMQSIVKELNETPHPLSYGMVCKFKSYIPRKSPHEILNDESDPWWWAYAETLRELIATLDTVPKIEFVDKRKKHA